METFPLTAIVGGALTVRNGEKTVTFDWDQHSADAIQWAAFYSDCEHEVHSVKAGHRITLTYNLYATIAVDLQAGKNPSALDGASIPLSTVLKAALSEPRFMFKGGKLAVYLYHRYPHTHKIFSKQLPACLKGIDMALYEAARAFDLKQSLICTTKESMNEYAGDGYGYQDSDGEEHVAYGLYFPSLKTLHISEDMVDDDFFYAPSGAKPMFEDGFVWLNNPTYKELSSAFLAVSNNLSWKLSFANLQAVWQLPVFGRRVYQSRDVD